MRKCLPLLLCWVLWGGVLFADAPGLRVEGEYVLTVTRLPFDVVAPPGADFYLWRVPAGWVADEKEDRLTVRSAPEGVGAVTVTTIAFVKDKDGKYEKVRASHSLAVAVGKAAPPVPPTPVPPVPVPASRLYFAVVRPDGPASPDFTRTMGSPAWDGLKAQGHLVKDFTLSRARELGIPTGAALPCVVTLRVEGGVSKVARPAVPLPVTADGIARLPEGVP